MDTLTHEIPQRTTAGRPRRTWLIVLIAVLVIAGAAVGTWAIIEANQTDELAIVTEFADTGDIAWVTGDGEAWAALFTEDGVWDGLFTKPQGRDAIRRDVEIFASFTEMRHGDVSKVEAGVYTYPVEGKWQGQTWAGEIEVTLEGDLVSYAELIGWHRVD